MEDTKEVSDQCNLGREEVTINSDLVEPEYIFNEQPQRSVIFLHIKLVFVMHVLQADLPEESKWQLHPSGVQGQKPCYHP